MFICQDSSAVVRLRETPAGLLADGRAGRPQEVADLVCFLASEHASYLTTPGSPSMAAASRSLDREPGVSANGGNYGVDGKAIGDCFLMKRHIHEASGEYRR